MTLSVATQPATTRREEKERESGRDVICQLNKINLIIKTRVRYLESKREKGGRR